MGKMTCTLPFAPSEILPLRVHAPVLWFQTLPYGPWNKSRFRSPDLIICMTYGLHRSNKAIYIPRDICLLTIIPVILLSISSYSHSRLWRLVTPVDIRYKNRANIHMHQIHRYMICFLTGSGMPSTRTYVISIRFFFLILFFLNVYF